MAPSATLVVPGRLDTRTGGYIYDRHIVDGLRERGWTVDVHELDESFPFPGPEAREHAARVFAGISDRTLTLVDSLALGAIPEILESHAGRLRLVALVHLPLAAAIGLEGEAAERLAVAERRALQAVRVVIVTGKATLPLLERYDVPVSRVAVVEPGTAKTPLSIGSDGAIVQLLCVATLNAGKGHDDLLESLAAVPSRNWFLTCVGSLTRDLQTVERVRDQIRRLQLERHVLLAGELDGVALEERYSRSDIFVLATVQETYGMAVAEALAHGLPVVSTTTGAISELVGGDAGLLVTPGDREALTTALARVIGDGSLRQRLAAGAQRARQHLPGWDQATTKMAAILESLHG